MHDFRKAEAPCPPPTSTRLAFLGGLACDLEGAGAEARQLTNFKIGHFYLFRKQPRLFHPFLLAGSAAEQSFFKADN
jgi:hypothetical protein